MREEDKGAREEGRRTFYVLVVIVLLLHDSDAENRNCFAKCFSTIRQELRDRRF